MLSLGSSFHLDTCYPEQNGFSSAGRTSCPKPNPYSSSLAGFFPLYATLSTLFFPSLVHSLSCHLSSPLSEHATVSYSPSACLTGSIRISPFAPSSALALPAAATRAFPAHSKTPRPSPAPSKTPRPSRRVVAAAPRAPGVCVRPDVFAAGWPRRRTGRPASGGANEHCVWKVSQ
jgi:hypothetical protein